jgi:uncharacterized protein
VTIPDGWPPQDDVATPRTAPLFPLPKVLLYPNVVMPLHIFEPRYIQMVEDLLDRPGWMVISPIRAGFEEVAAGNPAVYPVGGLGEIVKHSRLDDGRYTITLVGLGRVRIQEVESDHPYRLAHFEALQEVMPDQMEDTRLRSELRRALKERGGVFNGLPENIPLGPLSDLLLQNLDLPVDAMTETFAEPSVARRANYALAEHKARG